MNKYSRISSQASLSSHGTDNHLAVEQRLTDYLSKYQQNAIKRKENQTNLETKVYTNKPSINKKSK